MDVPFDATYRAFKRRHSVNPINQTTSFTEPEIELIDVLKNASSHKTIGT
jgi:hypothetical protein